MIRNLVISCIALASAAGAASAQSFTEHFDGSSLLPTGWASINNSPSGPGTNSDWVQTTGSTINWLPQAGAGYAAIGYNAILGGGDISVYLISPAVTLHNGDTLSFWTRTWDSPAFPDRMAVTFNTDGSDTPASFSNSLITINPNLTTVDYPTAWTQYTVTVSGLGGPASGRFAFWYNPTDGGPIGNNSDRIGLDEVVYNAVPAPGSFALLGIGGLLIGRRRR